VAAGHPARVLRHSRSSTVSGGATKRCRPNGPCVEPQSGRGASRFCSAQVHGSSSFVCGAAIDELGEDVGQICLGVDAVNLGGLDRSFRAGLTCPERPH
jgi:hypothetical protein